MTGPIRLAEPRDARGIAKVHVTTWQTAYRGIVPDDYLDALDVEKRIRAYEDTGVLQDADRPMFVFEVQDTIVGFVGVGPSNDEPDVGELYAIYVDAANWDTGVGAALMVHGESWLRERYSEATLWVLDENVRARRFYERFNWYADGTVKTDDRGPFELHEVRYRTRFSSP